MHGVWYSYLVKCSSKEIIYLLFIDVTFQLKAEKQNRLRGVKVTGGKDEGEQSDEIPV